jgi:hypothetical protein
MIRHQYNLQTFYNENALTYYLLGAFCTDGNIRILDGNKGRASVASKDYDWLKDINQYISPNKPITKERTCFVATYNSIELANWFIDHGCHSNKSLTLEVPTIPTKFVPDFIRGCWDGDGSLGLYRKVSKTQGYETTRRYCALFSGSQRFAEGMQQLLETQNVKSHVYIKRVKPRKIEDRIITSTRELYNLTVSGKKNIFNFCQSIYYDKNCLSLVRKEIIAKQLAENCRPKLG